MLRSIMAAYHPQVVHFAIALLVVGVLLRLLAFARRPAFVGPAATMLLLLGTAASAAAVKSGIDAHGPVERVPGSRTAVVEHEEWGLRTRNVFFGVAALELLALAMWKSNRRVWVNAAAAGVGVVGLFCLYQAGDHGGQLVYAYAGGVGIRSGNPQDIERLLLAGLYHQAQQDRKAGRPEAAAELIDQAGRRFPDDPEVQMLVAESRLVDRKNAAAALEILERVQVAADARALRLRHGMLRADALEAAGQRDGAIAVLQMLARDFSANARVTQRLQELQGRPATHP
jgi:uncharacterized membrane protein